MATIFIVEDDVRVTKLYKKILEKDGYNCISVTTGNEAIEKVKENEIDLILCDLKVPGEPTEIDLIKQLRTLSPNSAMIVSSGYVNEEIIAECKKLRVDDILTKPFELTFLREVVSKLLVKNKPENKQ
jgi:CheY-like chemotaxis protein